MSDVEAHLMPNNEGVVFSSKAIRDAKDKLTNIRDGLFKEPPPDWGRITFFTHIIVYLGDYALKIERQEREREERERK